MLLERCGLEVVMAFVKDMVRMWLHAWKRFVSIALISLLGVAVLTGIYAGCRDAFLATDRFSTPKDCTTFRCCRRPD